MDHARGGSPHGAGPLPGTERTPSTINSKTPPASSMPSISSSLLAMLQVRCAARVQQDTTGHRARTGDPLYPGPQSFARLTHAGSPHAKRNASVRPSLQMRHISVSISPIFTGHVCEVFHQAIPGQGQRLAAHLVERLPACPVPEIARLGRTLRKWKDALDAYFDTGGASNGSTEAINGHYRAGQTNRQRLPQPHQLPTPNAPHHRRSRCLHPYSTLKSHQTVGGPHPRPHVHRRQADRPVATPRNTGCIMSRQS